MSDKTNTEFMKWFLELWPEESMEAHKHMRLAEMAWRASRKLLVVYLPDPSQTLAGPSLYAQFKDAVEDAGVKVEVRP